MGVQILRDLMWRNQPGRLEEARREAREAGRKGNHSGAHSIMLSAYITALSGKPVEGHHPVKFVILALWHAFCMFWRRNELNHNQLDVWLQFMLRIRAKFPLTVGKPIEERLWYPNWDIKIYKLAKKAVDLSCKEGKPHQIALAYITCAEVRYAVDFHPDRIKKYIADALELEPQIRAESDQPQGLRQLVRVFRKAGELYCLPGMFLATPYIGRGFLRLAVDLARGEADAPDQLSKIERFLIENFLSSF